MSHELEACDFNSARDAETRKKYAHSQTTRDELATASNSTFAAGKNVKESDMGPIFISKNSYQFHA